MTLARSMARLGLVALLGLFLWAMGWRQRRVPVAGPHLALTTATLVWTLAHGSADRT